MQWTLKQVGGSTKGRGKPADNFVRVAGQPANNFVIVVDVGRNLEKNLQPTDGRCEQYTHKYSTYRVAQHDHISSREHAWLESCEAQDAQLSQSIPRLPRGKVTEIATQRERFAGFGVPLWIPGVCGGEVESQVGRTAVVVSANPSRRRVSRHPRLGPWKGSLSRRGLISR